jgi:hypothetical protein
MESSNNIIHPTRLKGLGFGSSCFGQVMMSVRRIGKSEQKCPLKETASVGISRLYSQFRAKPANDGRNTIWQLVG